MHAGASTNSPAFTPHRKPNIEHVCFPPRRLPGMAVIAVDEHFDLAQCRTHLSKHLPVTRARYSCASYASWR
jgi:hypothetical protein